MQKLRTTDLIQNFFFVVKREEGCNIESKNWYM